MVGEEGDSGPQDLTPTVTNKFWIRFGHGIKMPSTSAGIGVASVGTQWSFPTERLMLTVAPTVINAYDSPVSSVDTELLATEWMPFYDLKEILVAYESFDTTANFEYSVVLQSVKTDPTQEAPADDSILGATTGDTGGIASATQFTNATTNKAQLCRIVLKAKDNSGAPTADQLGRVYLAVSTRYA